MDRVRWIIFGVIAVGILAALVYFGNRSNVNVSQADPNTVERSGEFTDNIYGNPDGKVTLYEYGDFQCPGCASAFPIVQQLKEKYKDDLTFVFRNLPLTTIHPNALAAATAAEAAGKQGKYYEMHDLLYQNQSAWENASTDERGRIFEGYAEQLGVNMDTYRQALASSDIADKISRDRQLAAKAGADSTPTFVLNGTKLGTEDWRTVEAFDAKLQEAFKAAGVDTSQ